MPDYKNMPVQRGLSEEPLYKSNPRKYVLKRSQMAIDTCDKVIDYLGSIIQIYAPEGKEVSELLPEALQLIQFANENNISMDVLIDYAASGKMEIGDLGQFAGYIAVCALCIQTITDVSDTIMRLRRSI